MAQSFTAGGTQDPGQAPGGGDHGEIWDPKGGPNGTGAWVPKTMGPNTPTYVGGAWGGQGNQKDSDGNVIPGTSGMQQDINRYRFMGGQQGAAPVIDTTQSNESRGFSMNALGMLQNRANGGMTPAQEMAKAQTAGAVAGVNSAAASIKGGASMRAAAARNAARTSSSVQAQGNQDQQALRAREMADASGQYFGAASAQRGNDLTLSKNQADIQAQQNALNDNREAFYEDKAQDVRGQEIRGQMNKDQDEAAKRGQDRANDRRQRENVRWLANTGVGAVSGGFGAAKASGMGSDAPSSDDDSLSDEKTKANVRPLTGDDDGRAPGPLGRMRNRVRHVKPKTSSLFERHEGINDTIEKTIAKDNEVPEHFSSLPEDRMTKHGYAARRAGQPGSFGGPEASYDLKGIGSNGSMNGVELESAPGTADERFGKGEPKDKYSREIMGLKPLPEPKTPMRSKPQEPLLSLSDGKTKKNAKPLTEAEQDEADTKAFMGKDYKPKGTPEEEARSAKDDLDKAAFEAKERVAQQKKDADAKLVHEKSEYLRAREDKAQRAYHASPVNKLVPRFVDNYVDRKHAESQARPEAERAVEAERARAAQDDGAARLKEQAESVENLPGTGWVRSLTDRALAPLKKKAEAARARDTTLSPAEAKQKIAPVSGYENVRLRGLHTLDSGDGGDATLLSDDADLGRAHSKVVIPGAAESGGEGSSGEARFGGPTKGGKVNLADAERARAKAIQDRKDAERAAAPKYKQPKKMSDAEMLKAAEAMMGGISANREGLAGASTQGAIERSNAPMDLPDDSSYSDERTKQGAHGEGPMAAANRAMHPYEYEYKDEFRARENQAPGEKNVGPMAQEMDKNPITRTAIIKDPATGLMAIDKSKGLKLVMGGLSDLQRQVDDMQKKRRKA